MRFGYLVAGQFLPGDDPERALRDTVDQVRAAREAGFDSIWVTQHFLSEFQYLQPVPLLARMAAESGDMRLGTSVMLAPLYPVVLLAEELATLDVITGGRLIFGAGTGYRDEEFAAFGVPRGERNSRFEETVAMLRRLWRGESISHTGRGIRLDEARLELLPPQRGDLPVWIGATGPQGIRRAARIGDEWMISPELALDAITERQRIYRAALPDGVSASDKCNPLLREVFLARDPHRAKAIAEPALRTKYEAYARWGHGAGGFDELADTTFVLGNSDHCVDAVHRYARELDSRYVITRMQWPGLRQQDVLRSIEEFAGVIERVGR